MRPRIGAGLALALVCAGCTRVGTAPSPAPRAGPIGAPVADRSAVLDSTPAAPAAPFPSLPERPALAGTARDPARFAEVRGLWVVRYSLATPASVHAVVERAAAAGFNTLLVQVRGRGDAYYSSALEPRGAGVASRDPTFDPLAQLIAEARPRGMAVHAWVNVALVADANVIPSDARHLAHAHPEALMVPRSLARELGSMRPTDPRYVRSLIDWTRAHTDRVEGLYGSLTSPAVRERVVAVAADLAERYDLDGIHFDYIRYPGPDFDYSAGALEAFRAWAAPLLDGAQRRHLDGARGENPLAWPDSLPARWGDFRRQQVTTLLERAYLAIKTRRPWMIVSAAVHPDATEARQGRMQDWPGWARSGLLDAVAPMAYTADPGTFRAQLEKARAAAPDLEMWAGIGSYLAGLEGTVTELQTARALGTHGLIIFSYDWAVSGEGGGGPAFLERVGRALRR